jgi:hypothetical protein
MEPLAYLPRLLLHTISTCKEQMCRVNCRSKIEKQVKKTTLFLTQCLALSFGDSAYNVHPVLAPVGSWNRSVVIYCLGVLEVGAHLSAPLAQ